MEPRTRLDDRRRPRDRARSGLCARQTEVWVALDLEPAYDDAHAAPAGHVVRTEWVGAWQHHTRIARSDGTRQPLDTIGLKLNRYLGEHFYLTGQATARSPAARARTRSG